MLMTRIALSVLGGLACSWVAGSFMNAVAHAAVERVPSPSNRYRLLVWMLAIAVLGAALTAARLYTGVEVSAAPAIGILHSPSSIASTQSSATVVAPSFVSTGRIITMVLTAVAGLWLVLVLANACRLVHGMVAVRRMILGAAPANDEVMRMVERVARRMRMNAPVVRTSAAVAVPAVAGIIRPALLLSDEIADAMPAAQLQLVIAHELAHIRRGDTAVNTCQALVECVFFFCTPVRKLSQSIRVERELAADALAAHAFGSPLVLARALERLETLRSTRAPRLALAADDEPLLRRITALAAAPALTIQTPRTRRRAILSTIAATAAMLAVALASIAAVPASSVDNLLRVATPAAAMRQDINAFDDAGAFTLHVVGYRAVSATFDGRPFPPSHIRQRGDAVRFIRDDGSTLFSVTLRRAGGMVWRSR